MKTLTKKTLTLALIFTMICAFLAGVALFAIPANAATTSITIAETAEIRTDGTGIRFMITVNNNEFADLTKEGGQYEGYTASVGAVILPTAILNGAELKADATYGAYNPAVKDLTNSDVKNSDTTSTRYNVVMTDIPFASYEQELSARGFIKLVKEGETTVYIYTDTTASRSIGYVATLAYQAESTDEAVKADIATLLQNAITSSTASFDKATYEFSPSTSMESAFTFYGNKYNYVPDSAWLADNVEFVSGDDGVATVADGKITAKGTGSTTITAKIGETVVATSNIEVASLNVTDKTGKFSWTYDAGTSVSKKTTDGVATYTLTSSKKNIVFNYSDAINLNNANTDILSFYTTSPGSLTYVIVRFTDYFDSTKGVAIKMTNASSTGIGWGADQATYFRTGTLSEIVGLDDFGGTAVTNPNARLSAGENGKMIFRFNATGTSSMFSIYLPDPQYYGLAHTGTNDLFSAGNTDKKVNVSIELVMDAQSNIVVSNIGGTFVPDVEYESDSTNTFSWVKDNTTVVNKSSNGYDIKVVKGTKVINYNQPINLNNADLDILSFYTTSPSSLTYVIVRFTDYFDSTKGVAIKMTNASSTGIGWGADQATYFRTGTLSEIVGLDDFGGTAVTNPNARLSAGENGKMIFRFNATGTSSMFSIYLPDPQYYGLAHTGTNDLFSAGNTDKKVNVSIELIAEAESTIVVQNIGGTSFFQVA